MKHIPDSCRHHYSEEAFWNKLHGLAGRLARTLLEQALTLYVLLTQSETPPWAKGAILAALGYLICPFDALPDAIPGVGLTDDLTVMAALLLLLGRHITPQVKERVRQFMDCL